jgi:hypothetical protein
VRLDIRKTGVVKNDEQAVDNETRVNVVPDLPGWVLPRVIASKSQAIFEV